MSESRPRTLWGILTWDKTNILIWGVIKICSLRWSSNNMICMYIPEAKLIWYVQSRTSRPGSCVTPTVFTTMRKFNNGRLWMKHRYLQFKDRFHDYNVYPAAWLKHIKGKCLCCLECIYCIYLLAVKRSVVVSSCLPLQNQNSQSAMLSPTTKHRA